MDRASGDVFMVLSDLGLWRSADHGATFTRCDDQAIGGALRDRLGFAGRSGGQTARLFHDLRQQRGDSGRRQDIRRGKAMLRELKATLEDLEDRRELAAAKKRNAGKPGRRSHLRRRAAAPASSRCRCLSTPTSASRSRPCPTIPSAPPGSRNPNDACARSGTTRSTTSSMNCSRDDLVLLPIPFTDLSSRKVRPAIVIGFGSFPGDRFVVPLTSQLANAEFTLADWPPVRLNVPSGIKAQLATVESAVDHGTPKGAAKLPRRARAAVARRLLRRRRAHPAVRCHAARRG